VTGQRVPSNSLLFNHFAGGAPLKLDTSLVSVSCEQIKELLFTELGYNMRDQLVTRRDNLGLAKIFIALHPRSDASIEFSAVPGRHGVNYLVDLPNEMFASRFIETIVTILLIDLANAETHHADASPPPWLIKGLVGHLQSIGLETLPLESQLGFTKVKVRTEPVAAIRERLHDRAPLTFDELSWPEKLQKEKRVVFDDSAQLFVYELLHLRDGRDSLRKMIMTLPKYKNWQFAFFDAFAAEFSQTVNVEKWWALTLVNFTGRDPQMLWSREETEKKLVAAVKVTAQVYTAAHELPRRTELTLQQVIQDWEYARQLIALQKAISQLRILRYRAAPEMLSLVDDYRQVIEGYLRDRSPVELQKKTSPGLAILKKTVCRKLDDLDKRLDHKPAIPVAPKPFSSASTK
jgi:hypothetical protein